MVTVVLDTVQTPVVSELYVTELPDKPPVASGLMANMLLATNVLGVVCAPKLMVWLALFIVIVIARALLCPVRLPLEQLKPVSVTLDVTTCVGVPLMTPVVVLRLRPVGNVPVRV